MTFQRSRVLSVCLFLGGAACLALTAWINYLQGEHMGVTDAGKWVNSIGSVVVDIVGLVIVGLAAGACWAARRVAPAVVFTVVMLASAGWSINSMIGFQATERVSASKVRQRAIERDAEADKMAKGHLNWLRGTVRNAESGRERKDLLSSASAEITKFRQTKTEARIEPDAGANVIAAWLNRKIDQVQLGQVAYFSVLLIILKMVCFPSAAFFWGAQAGSSGSNQRTGSGSGGSGGGLKVVHPEPKAEPPAEPGKKRAEPSKQRGVFYVPATGAPERNLSAFDIAYEAALENPHLSTRALVAKAGKQFSQSTATRVKKRLMRSKADSIVRRYGNGRSYQTPAYN